MWQIYKVYRCLARYSPRATTTNQPTNRAPNESAGPICAQEIIFWGTNGCFWAKHPNYFEREQKLWYPHIWKPPRHIVCIVFLVGQGTKWAKKKIFGQKWKGQKVAALKQILSKRFPQLHVSGRTFFRRNTECSTFDQFRFQRAG